MALSNRDRVGRAFEALAAGLGGYVQERLPGIGDGDDPTAQLRLLADRWDESFRGELSRSDRNLVFELGDLRNRWAENQPFSTGDAYRALDSIERLLVAVGAPQATEVGRAKDELMRSRYEAEARKAASVPEAEPVAGLAPWREVAQPHDDVSAGRFALAEFAADLYQVRKGEGRAEYVDPVEFFRRTYLTAGLQRLLAEAAERVTGRGGSPVVDLQTTFGGGKTHSMIALYHLFSGELSRFPEEIRALVASLGVDELPGIRRVVLVGNQLKPGQPEEKPDGVTVRTMWGELAWQLGGAEGYALLGEADRTSTSPGDVLRELLQRYSPCLILIDEWVAYARQLYADDTLPGGTFDTHFSFAQALTEAARAVEGALLVVSIPASEAPGEGIGSDIEVGGAGGREALRRLRSVIGRMEAAWRPATSEESFAIVRRRLFQPLDSAAEALRDATCAAFGDFYRTNAAEFPTECRDAAYVERMKAAYPIHPELFDRLYEDWSTLERFQQTRGVLRLMAAVIHALWARGDQSPLIMPASVLLDDTTVVSELDRNLDDNWKPIIDTDVDGRGSLPRALDDELKNLGRYGAARRVARTIFLGSAPSSGTAHRGIEAVRVRLGCAMPGQVVAVYGDALTRLSDRATYLYVESGRYWYGTQPGVARLARDRTESYLTVAREEAATAIVERLRAAQREPGRFAGVHVAPESSADVPDADEARLVILGPDAPHVAKSEDSAALRLAREILDDRGTVPRSYRNMLVFLAADQRRLEDLERAVAEFLAWQSIDAEATELDLSAQQAAQARSKRADADAAVALRLADTYHWLLVPGQPDPKGSVVLEPLKAEGQAGLAVRAGERLVNDGRLYVAFPPVLLRMCLDDVLASLWKGGSVRVSELWDAFARYVYLPRLRDAGVLHEAARNGTNSTTWQAEGFATADAQDASSGRYLGLTVRGIHADVTGATLLVRPDVAIEQAAADGTLEPIEKGEESSDERDEERELVLRRFYGAVSLEPDRLSRDFGQIVQEVIAHLTGTVDARIEITIDVRAERDDGFPDQVVRVVTQNAKALGFQSHDFEER